MRQEYQYFLDEKPMILQFMSERTAEKPDGFAYIVDLMGAYRGWRQVCQLGSSKLSVCSFARALPDKYERKLMNRGRSEKGPARALLGLVLK